MATRPVFIAHDTFPYVRIEHIEFEWHSGLSTSQKKKSINSLHSAAKHKHPELSLLEVSTKGEEALGISLSAFNLQLTLRDSRKIAVENVFQSSKVFENGGPYKDLLNVSAKSAKVDKRLIESGQLIGFKHKGRMWPLEPETAFYDWIYINTLLTNEKAAEAILDYNAFTDIEFNPQKSLNCQARSVALYVSLEKNHMLEEVLESADRFISIFSEYEPIEEPKQRNLF